MAASKTKRYSSDRRERMKKLQREGKMTPEYGSLGGRPRKSASEPHRQRASQFIAERVRELAPQMSQVLADVLLDEDASRSDKLRAIRAMVNIEGAESDREADELADPNSARSQEIAAPADEAREQLAAMLAHPVTGERLRASLAGLLAKAGGFGAERLKGAPAGSWKRFSPVSLAQQQM